MLEIARLLASIAAILLLVSGAAWIKLFSGPELHGPEVGAATAGKHAEIASRVLITGAVLGAVAASLAVIARLSP